MIKIERDSFNLENIIKNFSLSIKNCGAVVTFAGYVRDFDEECHNVNKYLKIEYYEGMTEKALQQIEKNAHTKWNLIETRIIHRVGVIHLNEPIVFILVASKHRDNAFDACRYIIDYLKTEAPFWKKEVSNNHSLWVEQKKSDLVKVK